MYIFEKKNTNKSGIKLLLQAQHIVGCVNDIFDFITHFQSPRLRQLAPWAGLTPQEIPLHLLIR